MRKKETCPHCKDELDPLYRQTPQSEDDPSKRTFKRVPGMWCNACGYVEVGLK